MARTGFAYFIDLPDGRAVHVPAHKAGLYIPNADYGMVNPSNKMCGYIKGLGMVAITRTVKLKADPSRHECDARCVSARGKSLVCECACGGRNHGRGVLRCEAA